MCRPNCWSWRSCGASASKAFAADQAASDILPVDVGLGADDKLPDLVIAAKRNAGHRAADVEVARRTDRRIPTALAEGVAGVDTDIEAGPAKPVPAHKRPERAAAARKEEEGWQRMPEPRQQAPTRWRSISASLVSPVRPRAKATLVRQIGPPPPAPIPIGFSSQKVLPKNNIAPISPKGRAKSGSPVFRGALASGVRTKYEHIGGQAGAAPSRVDNGHGAPIALAAAGSGTRLETDHW